MNHNDSEEIQRLAKGGERFRVPIRHPEWLPGAVSSAQRTFQLAIDEILPGSIAGWMVTCSCLRILRAVYGDDLTTITELRKSILARGLSEQEHGRDEEAAV